MTVDPSKLELTSDDGTPLVTLVFAISLFFDYPLKTRAEDILGCVDRMTADVPDGALRWYATETMSKHKPVTARTRTMLPTWLSPETKPREYIAIELKDGETYTAAPHYMLKVFSEEIPDPEDEEIPARMLRLAVPFKSGADNAEAMANLFVQLAEVSGCRHAIAGFALVCSRYREWASQAHAFAKSMRHPGLDILVDIFDCALVGTNSIKGASWLTMIDNTAVKQLGGIDALRSGTVNGLTFQPFANGVVLRAGQDPQIGDTNRQDFLPAYRAAFNLVRPLLDPALNRQPALSLDDSDPEGRTREWLTRLERQGP